MIPSIRRFFARARAACRARKLDAELNEELSLHIALATDAHVRAGCSLEEARRRAHVDLGGLDQARELHRETRGFSWIGQFYQDASYATRVFRRERSFTLISLLILAVGVGLNTAVFSLVDTVVLRPLPFAEAKRLVWIYNGQPSDSPHDLSLITSTVETWEGLAQTNRSLDRLEAYNPFSLRGAYRLTGRGEPESISGESISPGLFQLLGLRPLLGRLFLAEDGEKNAPPRVLISHQLWARQFHSDPNVIGQAINLSGTAAEVVGVLPSQDSFAQVFSPAIRIDLYFPMTKEELRGNGNDLAMIGRLKPGIALPAARSDLARAVAQLKQQYASRGSYYFANVTSVDEWVVGGLRKPLLFLWGAAAFVLAIVGFTFGGLLLARGIARRRELALRLALGAARPRLLRQLLTECLTLTAVGAALGTLLAAGIIEYLRRRTAVEIPLLQSVRFDGIALTFTLLLCLVTAVLCGLSPAWSLLAEDRMQDPLKDDGRGSSGGAQHTRFRSLLVVFQMGLACVLVTLAGLMVRSFVNVLHVNWGFQPEQLLALRVDPVVPDAQATHYLDDLLNQVRAIPGIESAALTDSIPIERDRGWSAYPINAADPKDQRWANVHIRVVSSGLFHAMGTHILTGRDFSEQDGKNQVTAVVINQKMADLFWPKGDAVGRYLFTGGFSAQVIGVVQNVRHSGPEVDPGCEMYFSYRQLPSYSWDLVMRTGLSPSVISGQLRQALRVSDPTLPLNTVRSVQGIVDRALSSRKLLVALIAVFAGIALSLALLGIYGLISYSVTLQMKEIGIRMALGAGPAVVRREIILQTLKLAATGLAIGLVFAVASAGLMRSLLFGVTPNDPLTFLYVVLGLLGCSLLAGFLPALRASSIDPVVALRDG